VIQSRQNRTKGLLDFAKLKQDLGEEASSN